MTTHPLRTAQKPREAGPGGDLRAFEVEYRAFGVRRTTLSAQSEYALRSELAKRHPEWWPVSIVEVGCER